MKNQKRTYNTTHPRYTAKADTHRIYTCNACGYRGLSRLLIPRCGRCTRRIRNPQDIAPMP